MKTLNVGRVMYRGSNAEAASAVVNRQPNYFRSNLPAYFANTNNNANTYGRVVKYVTTRSLRLFDMSNVGEIAHLYASAHSNVVKRAIEKSFRTANGVSGKFIARSSKLKYDIHVIQFICHHGYDGYYAPSLVTKYHKTSDKRFHPEIVLCRPRDVLKVVAVMPLTRSPANRPQNRMSPNARRALISRTNYSSSTVGK